MSEVKKKILIATGIFPPDIGGPATYSKLLLEELPPEGFQVKVLPFSTVRHLPSFVRHLVYLFKVLEVGRSQDIIYAQDPVSVGFPVALANIFLGKKFILKVVGDFAWEQASARGEISESLDDFNVRGGRYSYRTKIHRLIQKFVLRAADRVIVPSNYLKKMIGRYLSSAQDKIKIIYNTFDVEEITETKEELRLKFGWAGPVVLTAGRLVPWKGIDLLVKILPKLLKDWPSLRLIVVGTGPEEKNLKNIADELRVSGQILFTGALEHDSLVKMIKAADVFALNTNYEGLSHVLLESMAIGTPIITTPVGGNVELIKNGETGCLASFNNLLEWQQQIARMIADRSFAEGLASRASYFVGENFGQKKMIAELIKELS